MTVRMRLAIFCVTYNTYEELAGYYRSVCRAAERAEGRVAVDFFVGDNTGRGAREIVLERTQHVAPRVYVYGENLGYLGAAQRMMGSQDVDLLAYDYVAISNVDLVLEEDALQRLAEYTIPEGVGWLAPALLSEAEGRDRNPGVLRRYSALRLRMLRAMFRSAQLVALYRATAYKRHRKQRAHAEGEVIYAGHGSFMLFTREYFARCGLPQFPMFLYGEELYFAEQCRGHALQVVYLPSMRIRDQEHASVSKMPSAALCRYNRASLGYILRTFY